MMLHKNSSRASLLKLLALTPIVGMTLALQAETVNDYVIEQPQNQTKVVKKGNQNAQVKVGTKKVEVKAAKPAAQAQTKAKKDATVKNVVVKAKKDAPTVSNVVVKTKKDPLAEGEVAIGVIDNDKDDRVWDVVEQMPKFPGGDGALMDFLHKSIKYPAEAEKAGKQGRVVVVFVVGKDGAVNNAKVVRSVDEKLDAEALRVVNAMPKWQPGKQNGQDVNVKFTIPVTFKLNKPAEKK
jgi:TonB family protein